MDSVYSKKFSNGLRLVVKKMDGLLSVSMGILVGTGSCYETAEENGISHYIEHMMFKGTQKRNAFEISDAMDRIGAQVNAFTSKDITCYYAKSTSEHVGDAFEILADFVTHSTFPEEEMEREKGVVLEEIAMTEDTPDDLCLDVLAEAYFGNEGYGRTILGPAENVRRFSRLDLCDYIAERYNPENIVVSFAGNIEPALAEELVEKYLAPEFEKRAFAPRTKKLARCGQSLLRTKDIEQVHIAFAYPSFPREDKRMDAALIVNTVLGGGMSSRLFQRVREQMGLAYTVYSYISSFTEGGILTVYAGVNPSNVTKACHAIMDTIEELRREKITQDEFIRGKEQLKSSIILAQENTASQMIAYGKHMLYNDAVLDLEQRVRHIGELTMEDCVQALAESFRREQMAAAAVGKIDTPLPLHISPSNVL